MKNNKKTKVYVLMNPSERKGSKIIVGIYTNKKRANLKLADYVLENLHNSYEYIEIVEIEIDEEE